MSKTLLAKLLGVNAAYVSRLSAEADQNEDGCVSLSQEHISVLRHEGFSFRIRSSPQIDDALNRQWETLQTLPATCPDADDMATVLRQFQWTNLFREINSANRAHPAFQELPSCLIRLRQIIGIDNWLSVAQAVGFALARAWEVDRPSLAARELVVRLLERDIRQPLFALPSPWEHSIAGGESPFACLQMLAIRSHIESRDCRLRVGLDLWAGYFPLWAARRQLRDHGIGILFIADSSTKMKLLLDGQIDVIGTTPGGLILRHGVNVARQVEILAILNRSNGADKVLHRPRSGIIRNRAQRSRAAVTAGSTSELLFGAFAKRDATKEVTPIKVNGYIPAAQLLIQDHRVEYVSTWEPYATLLCEVIPNLRVVASTTMAEFDLVADYLVSHRERSGRPLHEAIKILLRVWDSIITKRAHCDPRFLEQFSKECAIYPDACKRMLDMVSFFTTKEMASRARNEMLRDQFINVNRVVGISAHHAAECWRGLMDPIPAWLNNTARDKIS